MSMLTRSKITTTVVSIFIAASSFCSAFAADDIGSVSDVVKGISQSEPTARPEGGNTNDASPQRKLADSTASQAPVVQEKASLPKKVFGVFSSIVVGIPVCVVRRSKYEEHYGVTQMVGDTDNKFARTAASIFWLPFAITSGTAEAAFDATANSLTYCNRPFSKDQMSLGKLIQNN